MKENKKTSKKAPRLTCVNYFCVVEGQQEALYIRHLSKLLNQLSKRKINFNVKTGKLKDIEKNNVDYDAVLIFDYDFKYVEFERNLSGCVNLNKKNKRTKRNIYHAYSSACFDLWLILHKKYFDRPVSKAQGYINEVRRTFNLDSEADIKSEKIIEDILNQITLDDVKKAVERAEEICQKKLPSDAININGEVYYPNLDFSIHKFIKILIEQI